MLRKVSIFAAMNRLNVHNRRRAKRCLRYADTLISLPVRAEQDRERKFCLFRQPLSPVLSRRQRFARLRLWKWGFYKPVRNIIYLMKTNRQTKNKFHAVDFMRDVRKELTDRYFQDKQTYLEFLKKSMDNFKREQKKIYG